MKPSDVLNQMSFRREHSEQSLRCMRTHPITLCNFVDCCWMLVELGEQTDLIGDKERWEMIRSKSRFPDGIRGAGRRGRSAGELFVPVRGGASCAAPAD